jgi:hypothetical protein
LGFAQSLLQLQRSQGERDLEIAMHFHRPTHQCNDLAIHSLGGLCENAADQSLDLEQENVGLRVWRHRFGRNLWSRAGARSERMVK